MRIGKFLFWLTLIVILGVAIIATLTVYNPGQLLTKETQLKLYKTYNVTTKRLLKHKFSSRFSAQELEQAIANAKQQAWVMAQINEDLAPFATGITSANLDDWYKSYTAKNNDNLLIKVTIKNNIVTVAPTADDIKAKRSYKTVIEILELLAAKQLIPNCELLFALNDYLSFVPVEQTQAVAIFSFAKHLEVPVEKNTILVPDWMNLRYSYILLDRIDFAASVYPWEQKQAKIHWRGTGDNNPMLPRKKLFDLTPMFPFLDVGFTLGPNAVPRMDPEASLQFKYQIALDGARATWERMVWQLQSNAIMLKPESPHIQWFYKGIMPYEHYLPIAAIDSSNIHATYFWLNQNDSKAKQIAQKATEFAKANFKTQDMVAYYAIVLQEYAKLWRS